MRVKRKDAGDRRTGDGFVNGPRGSIAALNAGSRSPWKGFREPVLPDSTSESTG
jgi:hypothetical protein